jgi:hypothetical protein
MTPRLLERDIQRTCEDLLQLDGWRIFRLEQNFSEKKLRVVGEPGAPDGMYVRYGSGGTPHAHPAHAELFFVEWKRPGGVASASQKAWHFQERIRGAMTVIAGRDFAPDVDSFIAWYRESGLNRGHV